jgi:predicted nucleic acid-binding protein
MTKESFDMLQILPPEFRSASLFGDHEVLGLRAGDALHLAIAIHKAITLCTRDRRMHNAGAALGVMTLLL